MYSHDTQGLGHIRRNLLIARCLCNRGANPTILLLSGIREAASFKMPRGVDCLTIPSLGKDINGGYHSRKLDISLDDLMQIRTKTIQAALDSFAPDILIVDKVPSGAFDELLPSLPELRKRGTKIVLGLREILDDPEVVRAEWEKTNAQQVLRDYYDQIWIYGDPTIFRASDEYALAADLQSKVRYTGYLNPLFDHEQSDVSSSNSNGKAKSVLCVVGGGRDGVQLAESFVRAPLPEGVRGTLITGPLMPQFERDRLHEQVDGDPMRSVVEFVTNPLPYLQEADSVIAMAGYNTVCEIIAMRKRALLVPRMMPRTEQLIRAQCMADQGVVDMLDPDQLCARELGRWIGEHDTRERLFDVIDMNGTTRLPGLVRELLGRPKAEVVSHVI